MIRHSGNGLTAREVAEALGLRRPVDASRLIRELADAGLVGATATKRAGWIVWHALPAYATAKEVCRHLAADMDRRAAELRRVGLDIAAGYWSDAARWVRDWRGPPAKIPTRNPAATTGTPSARPAEVAAVAELVDVQEGQ